MTLNLCAKMNHTIIQNSNLTINLRLFMEFIL